MCGTGGRGQGFATVNSVASHVWHTPYQRLVDACNPQNNSKKKYKRSQETKPKPWLLQRRLLRNHQPVGQLRLIFLSHLIHELSFLIAAGVDHIQASPLHVVLREIQQVLHPAVCFRYRYRMQGVSISIARSPTQKQSPSHRGENRKSSSLHQPH